MLELRQKLDQRTEHVVCLQSEIEGLRRNLADLRAHARETGQKLKAAQRESGELRELADALAPERESLRNLQCELQQNLNDREILERENGTLKRQLSGLQSDIEAVRHAFASEQCRRIALEHSLSWAVTKPLRAIWDVLFVRRTG
jgi:chromosome segregation ATPase